MDIVATHDDSGLVKVLLGDGRGGFTPGADLTITDRPWGTHLADMDGDGATDLVAACGTGKVYLCRGEGSGGFSRARVVLDAGAGPHYVAAGDFNGDGQLDIAATHYEGGELRVWLREAVK